jgi:hypothetical protein
MVHGDPICWNEGNKKSEEKEMKKKWWKKKGKDKP